MKTHPECAFLIAAALLSWSLTTAAASSSPKASVAVLSTLHQFHEKVPGYGFETLHALLRQLKPDILAVELTAKDFASRKEQVVKQEYQRAVFPFLRDHRSLIVTLEPEEPRYSELVRLMRTSERELEEIAPQKAEALSLYAKELLGFLLSKWASPCDVNSAETDALFEVKHRYEDAVYGANYRDSWEGWNQYALNKIIDTARANPGKRIVVLMGAEHGYWLRNRLGQSVDVQLLARCAFE